MQLQVKDVAELFGVSEKTIYRWIEQDGLPAFRINKHYRFHRVEIMEWASARKVNASPQLYRAPEMGQTPLPDLATALEAGGIYYRIGGRAKDAVLRSVVELLRLPDAVDREFLLHILLEREAMGSTAIGDGIAIPHVRNPIVLNVAHPMIALCFLEEPIEFGALDGKPVHALFTIVSPTIHAHLHLLSCLAYALRDPAFKAAITGEASRESILNETRRVAAAVACPPAVADRGE